ncbi:UbiA prenyltransferase family protein [Streptomyces sp. NPDC090499]|uniref:UbiA prenyltransferase family protein n=1 Tax=Streptomyces sp. NPDC090499 TaxID=3365965 RepID=UPI00383029AD
MSGLGRIAWAVGVFTLASAIVYVVNDLSDRERDRLHPVKRHRPLASGRIGTIQALTLVGVLGALLIAACATRPVTVWWPAALYLAVNYAYSRGLKHVPLLDAFIVAFGFILRFVEGCLVLSQPVPQWLAICVFSVCLLLSLGKRRHELLSAGSSHRPALSGYTLDFVDHLIVMVTGLTAVSYMLFIGDNPAFAGSAHLPALLSTFCALFGLARYLQVLYVMKGGASPVKTLFQDPVSRVNSALWAVLLGAALLLQRYVA